MRWRFRVTHEDFLAAFKVVEPTSTREFLAERPRLTFKDIGGLTETKRTLNSILQRVRAGSALFGHARFNPPKGILLTGASGTGKTLLCTRFGGGTRTYPDHGGSAEPTFEMGG